MQAAHFRDSYKNRRYKRKDKHTIVTSFFLFLFRYFKYQREVFCFIIQHYLLLYYKNSHSFSKDIVTQICLKIFYYLQTEAPIISEIIFQNNFFKRCLLQTLYSRKVFQENRTTF